MQAACAICEKHHNQTSKALLASRRQRSSILHHNMRQGPLHFTEARLGESTSHLLNLQFKLVDCSLAAAPLMGPFPRPLRVWIVRVVQHRNEAAGHMIRECRDRAATARKELCANATHSRAVTQQCRHLDSMTDTRRPATSTPHLQLQAPQHNLKQQGRPTSRRQQDFLIGFRPRRQASLPPLGDQTVALPAAVWQPPGPQTGTQGGRAWPGSLGHLETPGMLQSGERGAATCFTMVGRRTRPGVRHDSHRGAIGPTEAAWHWQTEWHAHLASLVARNRARKQYALPHMP